MKVKVDAESDPAKRQQLTGEWDLHKRKAERAYQQLKEDTALAKASSDIDALTFDLEQSLPMPVLTTNIVFYKRQLWTYNLGIHDCKTSKAYMHMWHEGIASRGSQEIGSCLCCHLKQSGSTAKQLIAFSDACGGQNRNINLVCKWLHIVASDDYSYSVVDHVLWFMVSGHSYLPNDRDFGCIESAHRRQQHIFLPEDWYTLVEKARRTNPFTVVRMRCTDFVSVNRLTENITNRKTDIDGNKVEWLRMRWIRVEKNRPYTFSYRCVVYTWCCLMHLRLYWLFCRYTHNSLEGWKVVDIKKQRAGRPADFNSITLSNLYNGPRHINKKKADDLQQLLRFIPPVSHAFYSSLLTTEEEETGEE